MTGLPGQAAYIAALVILAVNSFSDVRRYEIRPVFTLVSGGLGLVYSLTLSGPDMQPLPTSLLPGAFFLLLSFLTGEAVGAGDGVLLLALAGYLGLEDILMTIVFGMLFSFAHAAGCLIRGKKGSSRFAFVPFLLAGYVLYLSLYG